MNSIDFDGLVDGLPPCFPVHHQVVSRTMTHGTLQVPFIIVTIIVPPTGRFHLSTAFCDP